VIYILLALFLYTAVIVLVTAASRHVDNRLVALIQVAMSVVIPAIMVVVALGKKTLSYDRFGISMAILGGLGTGLFAWAMVKSYSEIKVGIVAPVVFGGAIFFSTMLSYFIFKEKIGQLQFVGLLFLAIGFSIIIYARVTAK
jgi:drug/metabolite transporter (DMT)-like permease